MEFRKMVTITLYVRQQKRHRCIEQSFGLCGGLVGGAMIWENGLPFLVGKTPASLSSKGQIWTVANQGGALETRLKGPEKLIMIRRPDHLRACPHSNLVINLTLWNFSEEGMHDCYYLDPTTIMYLCLTIRALPIPQGGRHSSWGTSLPCSLFAKK